MTRKEITEMNRGKLALSVLGIIVGLAVLLSGCGPAPEPVDASPAHATPREVVESFYAWYVDYPGNPMVEGAYRSSEYLDEAFVQKVDGIIASFDRGGYDPFLCAQDVPASFTVEDAVVSGDEAHVVVRTSFEGHSFTVVLRPVNERWEISDVLCAQ
jgi:hypothetical protein